jgi:hypothetical protein
MGLFKRKSDPIAERERDLHAEMAALEKEIRRLSGQPAAPQPAPSAAPPKPPAAAPEAPEAPRKPRPPIESVFELVDIDAGKPAPSMRDTAAHYNDLGVRKYDIFAAWRRLMNHIHGPPVNNPKLVNYLAAGSIHGLRPLRYERRVARNRFIVLLVVLLLIIYGIMTFLVPHSR